MPGGCTYPGRGEEGKRASGCLHNRSRRFHIDSRSRRYAASTVHVRKALHDRPMGYCTLRSLSMQADAGGERRAMVTVPLFAPRYPGRERDAELTRYRRSRRRSKRCWECNFSCHEPDYRAPAGHHVTADGIVKLGLAATQPADSTTRGRT